MKRAVDKMVKGGRRRTARTARETERKQTNHLHLPLVQGRSSLLSNPPPPMRVFGDVVGRASNVVIASAVDKKCVVFLFDICSGGFSLSFDWTVRVGAGLVLSLCS